MGFSLHLHWEFHMRSKGVEDQGISQAEPEIGQAESRTRPDILRPWPATVQRTWWGIWILSISVCKTMHVRVCLFLYMYICICIYVYVYVYLVCIWYVSWFRSVTSVFEPHRTCQSAPSPWLSQEYRELVDLCGRKRSDPWHRKWHQCTPKMDGL